MRLDRPQLLLVFAALALMVTGCAKRWSSSEDDYYGGDGPSGSEGYASADHQMMEVSGSRPAPARKSLISKSKPAPAPSMEKNGAREPALSTVDTLPAAANRMVHYDGSAQLRVAKVDAAQQQITEIAAQAGGLVERQYGNAITVRVPVASFDATFAAVLRVGDVLDKSIMATDVTDQFFATELRLRTAVTTRERLVALLAKAEDEEDKLFLVREIQRITEIIDRLEGQSRTLSSLASMSRITAELVPRSRVAWNDGTSEADELQWIRPLSPFRMDVARGGKRLTLPVPDGMVDLREKGHWVVESADGTRAWAGRLPNQPLGDAAFWLAALQQRLSPEFASATPDTLGGFSTLRMVSRDDKPYVWMVGVRVVGNKLELVEVFYPSIDHERRHGPSIRAAFDAADGGAA
jgi:hypothetical protein